MKFDATDLTYWLHLHGVEYAGSCSNILAEVHLKMSTWDTNRGSQRGEKRLLHCCAAFKIHQSLTATWMEADSRGGRDISFGLWHPNEVWRRLTQHQPGFCYGCMPGITEVLLLKQLLLEGKQLFTQVCADAFLWRLNICVAVVLSCLFFQGQCNYQGMTFSAIPTHQGALGKKRLTACLTEDHRTLQNCVLNCFNVSLLQCRHFFVICFYLFVLIFRSISC